MLREVGRSGLGPTRGGRRDIAVIVDGGTAEAVTQPGGTCTCRDRQNGIGKSLASGWPNWPAGLSRWVPPLRTALKERKEGVRDAVAAAKAAVEKGIVPVGALAHHQAANADRTACTSATSDGSRCRRVLKKPLPRRCSGSPPTLAFPVVINKGQRATRQVWAGCEHLSYGDADGVIDPVKVTRSAV